MDDSVLFKSLSHGAKFDGERFQDDISFFKRAVCGSEERLIESATSRSLDFFGTSYSNDTTPITRNGSTLPKKRKRHPKDGTSSSVFTETESKQEASDENEKRPEDGDEEEQEEIEKAEDKGEEEKGKEEEMQSEEEDVSLFAKAAQSERSTKKSAISPSPEAIQAKQMRRLRNLHRIKVKGSDVPDLIESFSDLRTRFGFHEQLLHNISEIGYTSPTPIQMQAIPILLHHRDLLAVAPTGSGKTAAFVLPILTELLKWKKQREKQKKKQKKRQKTDAQNQEESSSPDSGIRALIVSPTRELAQQIHREACRLAGTFVNKKNWKIVHLSKATPIAPADSSTGGFKCDILVATPMRLVHTIEQKGLSLHNVRWIVLDEGDKLFEEQLSRKKQGKEHLNFAKQIDSILAACSHPQIIKSMWSATMHPQVEELARSVMHDDALQLVIGARNAATSTIHQELKFVGREEGKLMALRQMLHDGELKPPVLIFVQSKDRAIELFRELVYEGVNVEAIHADRTQGQRDSIVKQFRLGNVWVLITTDLMGRGMDFKGVQCVINYDLPTTTAAYIHRIGRTGRAGKAGRSVTFYTQNDVEMLKSIANVMKNSGCEVPQWIDQLEKMSRNKQREMERHGAPDRERISTVSSFDRKEARRQKRRKKRKLAKRLRDRERQKMQSDEGEAVPEEKGD